MVLQTRGRARSAARLRDRRPAGTGVPGALQLNMGTLYPGLMRLEQGGLLRGEWGVTDTNRQARFYAITAAGKQRLTPERRSGIA